MGVGGIAGSPTPMFFERGRRRTGGGDISE